MKSLKSDSAVAQPITRRIILGWGALGAAAAIAPDAAAASTDQYGLDDVSRVVPPRGPVRCPKVETMLYRGTHVSYQHPARIYVDFQPRLVKMEKLAADLALTIYGRPPRKLVHLGTFNCRRIGGYPTWISEHGLGNAIDLAGFDFGPLPPNVKSPPGLPRILRRPFSVRVERHWKPRRGPTETHARFLRSLARQLLSRTDVFRVLLGPAYPGHHNHFHFDMAPYRMVDGFEELGA